MEEVALQPKRNGRGNRETAPIRVALPNQPRRRIAVAQEKGILALGYARGFADVAPVPAARPVEVVVTQNIEADDTVDAAHAIRTHIHGVRRIPLVDVLPIAAAAGIGAADVVAPEGVAVNDLVAPEARAKFLGRLDVFVNVIFRHE